MATCSVFLPGKLHGQRSLAGYSPWGCKESGMTEHTHTRPALKTNCTSFCQSHGPRIIYKGALEMQELLGECRCLCQCMSILLTVKLI